MKTFIVDTSQSPNARLHPIAITDAILRDNFWQPRRVLNRDVTLRAQYEQCEKNGYFRNMARAAGNLDAPFEGLRWNDSDVFKWLEAASWALADAEISDEVREMVQSVADLIEAMQQPNGYLHSYFVFDKAVERFTFLEDSHELYNFGHGIQAAVAHFRATGSEQLLNVARRLGNFLFQTFGPDENELQLTDGHPEIEMALFELFRATGETKYLHLARFFVDVRGTGVLPPIKHLDHLGLAYHQSHAPLREQSEAVGHAVRALYLYGGATDYVLEHEDIALREALGNLWQSVTTRKMHLTGGVGARHDGESFGADYELPNQSAYCETCASIALVMWAWRLLLLTGESVYADVMERALYNGVLSGLSLDGTEYFYVNPLENDGSHRRRAWYGCACCPPNIARLMAQLPGYFASVAPNEAWLHLYARGTFHIGEMTLNVQTEYPWQGEVCVRIENAPASTCGLLLRVPAWCETAKFSLNGETVEPQIENGYAHIEQQWQSGDEIVLNLEMPARRVVSHPKVSENRGCIALMRGPIVYCWEEEDLGGAKLEELAFPAAPHLEIVPRPDLLGSVVTIQTWLQHAPDARDWESELSRFAVGEPGNTSAQVRAMAIPYYAWANRSATSMRVWLPRA